ncbi:MAG: hypothetical protein ACRD1T_26430, partial [Acidimicrobiia bacterium]
MNSEPRSRLVVIAGPLKGTVLGLSNAPSSGDEQQEVDVALTAFLGSEAKSFIRHGASGFEVRNEDSERPIFVNGLPVKERLLADGDQLGVGESLLVFRQEPLSPAEISGEQLRSSMRIELRREDALFAADVAPERGAREGRT